MLAFEVSFLNFNKYCVGNELELAKQSYLPNSYINPKSIAIWPAGSSLKKHNPKRQLLPASAESDQHDPQLSSDQEISPEMVEDG